jgi:hypothetical protein
VGTSIRQLDQNFFPSRLYRLLTNSLSGTPAGLSSQTISRPIATEATIRFTTQHTIIPLIQYLDFFLTQWHIIPHLFFPSNLTVWDTAAPPILAMPPA